MRLKIGTAYRVYMPDGERHVFSIIRLTVVSDEGGGWYKVNTGGDEFFLNLNQAIRVYED
ncbi:MAG: hypothetical protein AABN95_03630 [Acidobacteriota bacterium]